MVNRYDTETVDMADIQARETARPGTTVPATAASCGATEKDGRTRIVTAPTGNATSAAMAAMALRVPVTPAWVAPTGLRMISVTRAI